MKRVTEHVALQTILYVVGGLQKIKILDKDHERRNDSVIVYSGLAKDWMRSENCLLVYERAAVREIEIDEDTLVLKLDTAYEQY